MSESITKIKVKATLLDPETSEAGIVEIFSGKVLRRFSSVRRAAAILRHQRPKYEAQAWAAVQ